MLSNNYPSKAQFTNSPYESMTEAFSLLELTFRLQKGFEDNLINEICFTRSIGIDTGIGTGIKERCFDLPNLKTKFHNLVLIAIGGLMIVIDEELDKKFKDKKPSVHDDTNSLRSVFYMLRNAFAHDMAHPRWKVTRPQYLQEYKIIIPKGVMRFMNNEAKEDKEFKINFRELNNKTVEFHHFEGLETLICLSLYAMSLVQD